MISKDYNFNNQPYVCAPKAIWKNKKYKDLDPMSKLVYISLLDKLSLSKKNGWCDEDGKLYCKATVRTLGEEFCQTPGNMSKKLKALEEWGLIVRKSTGWCHADIIFVNEVEPEEKNNNSDSFWHNGVADKTKNVSSKKVDVAEMQPNNNNIIIQENNNVKQQHTDSTTLSNIECAADDTGDVNVVVKLLENFGVTAGAVRKLIHQYPVARIKEVVQVVRERVSAIHNVAGYIYSALKNNYQFTKKQENTTPIVQIVTESDSKGALEEDRSNHTNEPISAPCEPPTEKYIVQERPKVDTESEEKIQSMKDWISRIYKQRGEVVRPLHKWMENHGLRLDENGDVVPAI